MKKIKVLKVLMLIFVLMCTFTISKNIAQAVSPRASNGYHWADKNATIEFYPNLPNYRTSIEDAIATWNAVTDYRTGEPIVPMSLIDDFSCQNKITMYHNGTAEGELGKMVPDFNKQTGELNHVTIFLNFDMPIADGPSKWMPEYYDAQSIIVHELGHAIGIAHCHEKQEVSCYSKTCTSNVMRPTLAPNTHHRTLAEYDIASKQLIYYY